MERISLINPMPIYFGLFGRFLDILTTIIALSNPINFEANPFYVNQIINLPTAFFACLLPQLTLLKWPCNRYPAYAGSHFVAFMMFIPVINNIRYII